MDSPNGASALVVASLYNRLHAITEVLEDVGWTTTAVQHPREALDALRSDTYEAIFCDEYLRGASPGGFLAWSRRLVPEVPFHLFCVDEEPKILHGANQPDSLLMYPPVAGAVPQPEVLRSHKPIRESARDLPLEGNTSLTPLSDLIEMMGVSSQSATITLEAGKAGSLYIEEGTLVHVVNNGTRSQGVRALAELLQIDDIDFEVRPFSAPRRKTIHLPTTSAVTEAARLNDEQSRDEQLVDTIREACPSCDTLVIGYPLAQAPSFGMGESDELFVIAKGLIEQNRDLLGRVTHVSIENDRHGYAMMLFGEGNLIAGRVPQGKSLVLLAALARAVKGR
jgi:CheY-like chemotaxis protein